MSDCNRTIEAALKQCEETICEVISNAAQEGSYQCIETGISVAQKIATIRSSLTSAASIEPEKDSTPEKPRNPGPFRKSTMKGSSPKSSNYPRFEINSKNLVRFGWSKSKKKEYNHKVPIPIVHAVTDCVKNIGLGSSGPHSAEEIIERFSNDHGEQVPNYQVYAVLAYLKLKGFIEQQGREGYSIPAGFNPSFEENTQS